MNQILSVFFNEPLKQHYFREIVRKSRISPNIVQAKLKKLINNKQIMYRGKQGNMKFYVADRDNQSFINMKKLYNLEQIYKTKLLEKLDELLSPNAIILFGSYCQGFDTESSDIDLLVVVEKYSQIPPEALKNFEHQLNRKINLHIVQDFSGLNPELKNNMLNGTLLHGYIRVFDARDIPHTKGSGKGKSID